MEDVAGAIICTERVSRVFSASATLALGCAIKV